jgi:hypothetical protein
MPPSISLLCSAPMTTTAYEALRLLTFEACVWDIWLPFDCQNLLFSVPVPGRGGQREARIEKEKIQKAEGVRWISRVT